MLLLCGFPGEVPLKPQVYKKMMRALYALGAEYPEPDQQVTERELTRLGCSGEEAEEILRRLSRQEELLDALSRLEQRGIRPVTRISGEYPERLREQLGDRGPLVLWCGGNTTLFQGKCISLVGSRRLREPGRRFAYTAGDAIARQGFCYCSGGAVGADSVGLDGALEAGGSGIVFLANSLLDALTSPEYREPLAEGRLLFVSEGGFDLHFSTPRALSRNRLIHAMGEKTLVAQSDYGTGGTWSGTMENLKEGWSPVLVSGLEPEDPGAAGLVERGGSFVSLEKLNDLRAFQEEQLSFL